MSRTKQSRRLRPHFESLEARQLLSSSAQFIGFSNVDTTGPTAAVGPGGYENLHIQLTLSLSSPGQSTTLDYLNIAGPPDFQWTYHFPTYGDPNAYGDPNPQANPKITVSYEAIAPNATNEIVDVFFSPVVQYVNPTTGVTSFPLLPNGSTLAITAKYTTNSGQITTDSGLNVTATGLTTAIPYDPAPTLPGFGVTYPGTAGVQTSDGMGHVNITLPDGSLINNATAELSDVAGLYWNYGVTLGRGELGIFSITYSNVNGVYSADIAFPPERDEAGTDMTFLFQLGSSSTEYVTNISIPSNIHTDPNLRDGGPISTSTPIVTLSPTSSVNMVMYTSGGVQSGPVDIQTFLNMGFKNVELADGLIGGIYTINEQLNIPSGMILQGADSNVTLMFTMSSVTQGVINFAYSHITLEGFKIRFGTSPVNFLGLNGHNPAIISDLEDLPYPNEGDMHSRVDLNVENLDIQVPETLIGPIGDNGATPAVSTVIMGPYDSGTIQGNTIRGGAISVAFGPWLISGNKILGTVQGTVSENAFAVSSGHDVTIGGTTAGAANTFSVNNPAQDGTIDRFFVGSNSGYNIQLLSNVIQGNAGEPAPIPNGTSSMQGTG